MSSDLSKEKKEDHLVSVWNWDFETQGGLSDGEPLVNIDHLWWYLDNIMLKEGQLEMGF